MECLSAGLIVFLCLMQAFDGLDLAAFLEKSLPELPDDARGRLQNEYGLNQYVANVLTSDPPAIQLFDKAVSEAVSQAEEGSTKDLAQTVANLLTNELFALVREYETVKALEEEDGSGASVKFSAVSGRQLGAVVVLLAQDTISNTMAKQLLRILYAEEKGKDPRVVANERGFRLITDSDTLTKICHAVIEESPEEMERYRMGGKFARKISKFLLGKAMQKSNMNAHPQRLNEVMMDVLDALEPDVEK